MHSNGSDYDLDISKEASVFLATFTALQILAGSIANSILIITILSVKELRKRSEDLLILNLAVADFLAVTTFLPLQTYVLSCRCTINGRFYGPLMALVFNHGGNAILAIAIDKFFAVMFPFRHKRIMTKTASLIIAVVSWTIAALLAIVTFLRGSSIVDRKILNVLFLTYDILLLIAMIALYIVIFLCAAKQRKAILKQKRSIGVEYENFFNCFLFKTTLTTLGFASLYCTTYLPLLIYVVHSMAEKRPFVSHLTWINSFLFLNSSINPFTYAFRTRRFKAAFHKKLWPKFFKTKQFIKPLRVQQAP